MGVSLLAGLMSGIGAAVQGLSFWAAFAVTAGLSVVSRALSPRPKAGGNLGGQTVTKREPAHSRKIVYGRSRIGGNIVYLESSGDDNKYLWLVIAVAGHEIDAYEEVWFNDQKIWDGGSYVSDWGSYVDIGFYKGDQTSADNALQRGTASLVSNSTKWTDNHKLLDTAYMVVKLTYDRDQFSQGLPNISTVIRGKKVWHPNHSSPVWSQNPALCLRDYLTDTKYGLGESASNIASINTALGVCDEPVDLAAGGTQLRYTLNGVVDTANTVGDNIEQMLGAMVGRLLYVGGKFEIHAGKYVAPTITIDESMVVGEISVQTKQSRRNAYNAVKGVFLSEDDNYVLADYPAQISSSYATSDGEPLYLDMTLPFTTNHFRAQRIAKLALLRSRQQEAITIPCNLSALKFKIGDNIFVTNSRLGYSSKIFEVVGYSLDLIQGGSIVVNVDAVETASSIWDWTTSDEEVFLGAGEVDLYDGSVAVAPASLTVTPQGFIASDGTYTTSFNVSFPASVDAFVKHYVLEWKKQSDGSYFDVIIDQSPAQITGLETGSAYDVRIKAVNDSEVSSSYTTATQTIAADSSAPNAPSAVSASGEFEQITINWTNPTVADFSHVDVYRSTSSSGTYTLIGTSAGTNFTDTGLLLVNELPVQKFYKLRSVDYSGNATKDGSGNPVYSSIVNATTTQVPVGGIADDAVDTDQIADDAVEGPQVDSATTILVGSGANTAAMSGLASADLDYRFWAGAQTPSSASFTVDESGAVVARDITIVKADGSVVFNSTDGFTDEAFSDISNITGTAVTTLANTLTDDSDLETITLTETTTLTVKGKLNSAFSGFSTASSSGALADIPDNLTIKLLYKEQSAGSYTTLASQAYTKTTGSPSSTQYKVLQTNFGYGSESFYNAEIAANSGAVNADNFVVLTGTISNLAGSSSGTTYLFKTEISTSDGSYSLVNKVTSSADRIIAITSSGAGFYLENGTGSQGAPEGDITAVTAGTNLSGGGTSGGVTLNLASSISLSNVTLDGYLRGPSTFTIDPAAYGDDTGTLVIAGNLQVDGTTTTINSTTVNIEDLNVQLASDAANASAANGAGITVGGANAELKYIAVGDKWTVNKTFDVAGSIIVSGAVDGRDIATDGGKLDGIEASADVTDATNVTAAGALMDSELTSIASVKALNQGVATTDSPDFAALNVNGTATMDGLTVDGTSNLNGVAQVGGSTDLLYLSGKTGTHAYMSLGGSSTAADFFIGADTAIPLIFRTNATERMRIDSIGRVGIGTSSPDTLVQATNTSASTNYISYEIGNSGIGSANKGGFAIYELGGLTTSITYVRDGTGHTDFNADTLVFNNAANTAERMRIDSSGRVGIGTSSPTQKLSLYAGVGYNADSALFSDFAINDGAVNNNAVHAWRTGITGNAAGHSLTFSTLARTQSAYQERMRIDSSGNLNVGCTDGNSLYNNSGTNDGAGILANGQIQQAVYQDVVHYVNRTGNDGTITSFQKNGTNVGSIGTANGDLHIDGKAHHSGVRFQAGSLLPRLNGADTDNTIDLGYDDGTDTHRFKDLYLSGVANVDGISSSGNVTIGSSSLSANAALKFQADTGTFILEHERNSHSLNLSDPDGTGRILRIDTSGNLMLGTTSSSPTSGSGFSVQSIGRIFSSVNGGYVASLNRGTSDGEILRFRKDGPTVGSIGTYGNGLLIGTTEGSDAFLKFESNAIRPATSTGGYRDAAIDLGHTSSRFKDLYLLGTAYAPLLVANDIKATGSGGISFQTDEGTKRLEISDAGNVNIPNGGLMVGATTVISASKNLENIVNATIRGDIDTRTAQNTTQTEKLKFGINNGNAAGTSDTIGGGIEWAPLYGGYSKRSAGILAIGEGNYFRAGLAFYTNNTANATTDWSERMRLTMEGNLNLVSGSFTMGGTTVIDASRNLTNIGTISSGAITSTGNVTAYSDERLKSDIHTLDGKKVLQMRGVSFTKDGEDGSGVIAQELEKVAPELVLDGEEYKSVAYGNLVGYLIENAKEQQKEIDELKSLVKQLLEK